MDKVPPYDAPAMTDPLIGRRISSYTIERRIGAGGMGAVYMAVQPALGKRVAIKFLATHLSGESNEVERFFDEARAVNLIQHQNIVDIFDFGRTADGYSYFVMELMAGRSLGAILAAEKKLSPIRAIPIVRQIASALAAAHARNIIHRDIKPDNVFVLTREAGEFVKVVDFGIAKLLDQTTRTASGAVMGSAGFMSPEQSQGQPVDARTDIYALGVLAYYLLSGVMPFDAPSLVAILTKQVQDQVTPILKLCPDLDRDLAKLIHQMLASDRDRRPNSVVDLLRHPAFSGDTTASLALLLKESHRRRKQWIGVAAVSSLLVATLVFAAHHASGRPDAVSPAEVHKLVKLDQPPSGGSLALDTTSLGNTREPIALPTKIPSPAVASPTKPAPAAELVGAAASSTVRKKPLHKRSAAPTRAAAPKSGIGLDD